MKGSKQLRLVRVLPSRKPQTCPSEAAPKALKPSSFNPEPQQLLKLLKSLPQPLRVHATGDRELVAACSRGGSDAGRDPGDGLRPERG